MAEKRFMGLKSFEAENYGWVKQVTTDKKMAAENFDDSKWKTMKVPHWDGWETVGFEALDGAVWLLARQHAFRRGRDDAGIALWTTLDARANHLLRGYDALQEGLGDGTLAAGIGPLLFLEPLVASAAGRLRLVRLGDGAAVARLGIGIVTNGGAVASAVPSRRRRHRHRGSTTTQPWQAHAGHSSLVSQAAPAAPSASPSHTSPGWITPSPHCTGFTVSVVIAAADVRSPFRVCTSTRTPPVSVGGSGSAAVFAIS